VFPDVKDHRRTTRADYRAMVENHLLPYFGGMKVAAITSGDVDAYVVVKRTAKQPLGPQTLGQHLNRLHAIFRGGTQRRAGGDEPGPGRRASLGAEVALDDPQPGEVAAVMRAFDSMAADAETETAAAWALTARAMTATMVFAWLRRGELLGLRWRDVELAHPNGPRLHVRQTFVRGHESLPKTDEGSRSIALAGPLADELFRHLERTAYGAPNDLVFCHPHKGTAVGSGYFKQLVGEALRRAGVERPMREFHDWRHTGITNAAAAGMPPVEIMCMAGHADFKTTTRYIDLAGSVFSSSVDLLGTRFGEMGTRSGSKPRSEAGENGSVAGAEAEAA